MLFGYFTLLIALVIESVGAFYSVTGLAAIFSGAVVPTIIMGAALEVGKVTAAVWLKTNWHRAKLAYKLYLVPAVMILMFLTSMGIFGFLSKAHSDQSLVSGDVQAKIAIYDQKIQIANDSIQSNKNILRQFDEAVDQVMSRSKDASGAEKAVQLRRAQNKDRVRVISEIEASQALITRLNDEAAPIRAEIRKVEAEVGPIKYIAKVIYDDNPDANLLEKAVTWVIMVIVAVFDPLALVLILAAQQSIRWAREEKQKKSQEQALGQAENQITVDEDEKENELENFFLRAKLVAKGLDADEDRRLVAEANGQLSSLNPPNPDYEMVLDDIRAMRQAEEAERQEKESLQLALDALVQEYDKLTAAKEQSTTSTGDLEAKLNAAVVELETAVAKETELQALWTRDRSHMVSVETERNTLQVTNSELQTKNQTLEQQLADAQTNVSKLQGWVEQLQADLREAISLAAERNKKLNDFVSKNVEVIEVVPPVTDEENNGTVLDFDPNLGYEKKYFHKTDADEIPESGRADFGTKFPPNPGRGDMYLRVDFLPPVLYKWNSAKWIEIDRKLTDRLAYNQAYIEHLVAKIRSGEYDIDDLNDVERAEVAAYLNGNGTLQ